MNPPPPPPLPNRRPWVVGLNAGVKKGHGETALWTAPCSEGGWLLLLLTPLQKMGGRFQRGRLLGWVTRPPGRGVGGGRVALLLGATAPGVRGRWGKGYSTRKYSCKGGWGHDDVGAGGIRSCNKTGESLGTLPTDSLSRWVGAETSGRRQRYRQSQGGSSQLARRLLLRRATAARLGVPTL